MLVTTNATVYDKNNNTKTNGYYKSVAVCLLNCVASSRLSLEQGVITNYFSKIFIILLQLAYAYLYPYHTLP